MPVASMRCEGVTKQFGGRPVLADVGFALRSGEILGLVGPNGAGKTTLLECLAGLLPWDAGTLYWEDRQADPLRSRDFLFYLPDGVWPYPDQPAGHVLAFFCRAFGAGAERLAALSDRLRLRPVLETPVTALSKGYRRRLLLAIGLLSPQPLLLLDEPFDGFDLRQALDVMQLLRETVPERTLLLSVHQLSEAQRICHRFLFLVQGRLVASGTLEELRARAGLREGGLEEVFLALA